MSERRRADIETIDLALQGAPLSANEPIGTPDDSPIDTVLAPVPGTPTVVPAQGKVSPTGKLVVPDEPAAATEGTQETEVQLQGEIRQQNALLNTLSSVWSAAISARNGIGNIPIPGGLTFAILTLLVLFFLIVQVNGKSRFTWLWLVLTGNATVDTNPSNPGTADNANGSTGAASGGFATGSTSTPIPAGTFGAGNDAGGFGGGASGNFGGNGSAGGGTSGAFSFVAPSTFASMQTELV